LIDVELDFEEWHGGLHFVEISRGPVDSLWNILLNQVEIDLVLLPKSG